MKRILCVLLCLTFVLSLAACSKKASGEEDADTKETTAQTEEKDDKDNKDKEIWSLEETKEDTTKKGSLKDKTKVELPLAAIDEKYQNDLDAYCRENGYLSAKLNKKNGTVTVTMKTFTYELMLTNVGLQVVGAIYDVANNKKDYPYINKIESYDSKNFKSVVYSADAKTYPKNSLASYMLAQSCMLYQFYTVDKDCRVEITVIDQKTNEIIEKVTYTDKEILTKK